MSDHQYRAPGSTPSATTSGTGSENTNNVHLLSNSSVQDMVNSGAVEPEGTVKDPTEVVLYLTLNNTTHQQDEIPETMSALKQAEKEGLGHRELMAISDPYWSKASNGDLSYGDGTYAGVFGEKAANRVEWWHGSDDMTAGQVKVGDQIMSLGTESVGSDATKQQEVVNSWQTTVMALGMDQTTAESLTNTLFKNKDGSFRPLDSGGGATNELVQFAMAMYRAEKGEIEVKNIVFSGHHWRDENQPGHGQGIWGEVAGADHEYDDISDYFSLVDMALLKDVFPKAYAQVKSVQLAACNTDSLGMTNDAGEDLTTNEFLQDTFSNIEMSSYWKEVLAPLAKSGAETNGEFILDSMRMEGDRSDDPARDSRHNTKGLKRSLLDNDGKLGEITMKTNKNSYTPTTSGLGSGRQYDGLRDKNKNYSERTDLADYLYASTSLDEQKKATNDTGLLEEDEEEIIRVAEESDESIWDIFNGW